jgi:hypothetical protein
MVRSFIEVSHSIRRLSAETRSGGSVRRVRSEFPLKMIGNSFGLRREDSEEGLVTNEYRSAEQTKPQWREEGRMRERRGQV